MTTHAARQVQDATSPTAETPHDALPVTGRGEARQEAALPPHIIEISDEDYRSFCFPCHALEEAEDGNAGA